ncbi:MAG: lysylphosphatidylglycerol synthase transmembrane domain-containing protein [Aminivibrio sp.]
MTLRRGLVLFLLLSFGVSAAVLFYSVDGETWRAILRADKRLLMLALSFVLLAWVCDSSRFCALARSAGERIDFGLGMALTWLHYFGCAVTPMQSGGGPFQVYALYKRDVPIGKGIAITLTRTLLTILILGFMVPVAVIIEPELLSGHLFLKGVFSYVVAFIIISWTLVVLSIARPEVIKRWGRVFTLWLKKFGIVKPEKVLKIAKRINLEVDNYHLNFKMFFSCGLKHFLFAILLSFFHLLCLFSVLPCLIASVGLPFHYVQAILAQAVFMFLLYFVPTPGASGVAEGGGAALFGLLVPWNMAGVMAIAWRFFTEYLAIAMGVIVAVKMLGWGVTEEIYDKEPDPDENIAAYLCRDSEDDSDDGEA